MTNRDFYASIAANENLDAETRDFAAAQIEKLDKKSADARKRDSEKRLETNAPIIQFVLGTLGSELKTASELVEAYNLDAEESIKVQKMSAVLRGLASTGDVLCEDIKVPKKGTQKAYKLA